MYSTLLNSDWDHPIVILLAKGSTCPLNDLLLLVVVLRRWKMCGKTAHLDPKAVGFQRSGQRGK